MATKRYYCNSCKHEFDEGRVPAGFNTASEYRCCPLCGSWHYGISGVKMRNYRGTYTISYVSTTSKVTLYKTKSRVDAMRAFDKFKSLKWDVFKNVISNNPMEQAARYCAGGNSIMSDIGIDRYSWME